MNSYIALYGLMSFACWFVKKIQIPSMNFLNKIVNIPIKYNLMIEILNKHGETISAKMYPDNIQILDDYGNMVPETLPCSKDTSSEEETKDEVSIEEPSEEPSKESSEESSKESSEESSEEPSEKQPNVTTEELSKDEVKDTTEEPTKDEVKDTTEEPTKDEVKNTTEEPSKVINADFKSTEQILMDENLD